MLSSNADLIVGGTGIFACQLAKNIFKVGKVITTVSTAKVPKVKELLGEGVVDESKSKWIRCTLFFCSLFPVVW